jgi:predicted dehydrogenase
MKFGDVLGTVTATHFPHANIRQLQVTTRNSFITLDYIRQDIEVQRRGRGTPTNLFEHGGYRAETIKESPFIRNREPLKRELEHFLDCVKTGREPLVGGSDGLEVVELANDIFERLE